MTWLYHSSDRHRPFPTSINSLPLLRMCCLGLCPFSALVFHLFLSGRSGLNPKAHCQKSVSFHTCTGHPVFLQDAAVTGCLFYLSGRHHLNCAFTTQEERKKQKIYVHCHILCIFKFFLLIVVPFSTIFKKMVGGSDSQDLRLCNTGIITHQIFWVETIEFVGH